MPVDGLLPEEQREILDTIAIFPETATLTFAEDQTYTVSDPSLNNDLEGTWSLNREAGELTITGLDQASQFLGTNSLTFNILDFTASDLSLLTAVPEISLDGIPGAEELEGTTVSAEYQLDLTK